MRPTKPPAKLPIKSWGRGIEKVRAACRAAGTPMATLELDNTDVMARLYAAAPARFEEPASAKTAPGNKGVSGLLSSDAPTINPTINNSAISTLTPKQQLVLNNFADNPGAAQEEAAEALSVSRSTVATHTVSPVEKGMLKRIGSKKSSAWLAK